MINKNIFFRFCLREVRMEMELCFSQSIGNDSFADQSVQRLEINTVELFLKK